MNSWVVSAIVAAVVTVAIYWLAPTNSMKGMITFSDNQPTWVTYLLTFLIIMLLVRFIMYLFGK